MAWASQNRFPVSAPKYPPHPFGNNNLMKSLEDRKSLALIDKKTVHFL